MTSSAKRILTAALAFATLGSFNAVSLRPAAADTATTAAIIAGAAAITGALLYDGSNHPYYIRNGRRYYVTQQEAQYYRGHHSGYERRAWVPENSYPVSRDPYHGHDHH